jgi:hypothetical protein
MCFPWRIGVNTVGGEASTSRRSVDWKESKSFLKANPLKLFGESTMSATLLLQKFILCTASTLERQSIVADSNTSSTRPECAPTENPSGIWDRSRSVLNGLPDAQSARLGPRVAGI